MRAPLAAAISRLLAYTLMLALLAPLPAGAWGYDGHTWVNRTAAQRLPKDMPRFLHKATAQLAYLGYEPDRWRDRPERTLRNAQAPDHFIDLERVDDLAQFPIDRYEFYKWLEKKRATAGDKADDYLPEKVGLQPYITMEVYERLRTAFRNYRRLQSEKKPTREIEQTIIFYAGWLGHYVADATQPLHATIHFDGWVGPNPEGFRTQRGIHGEFEGAFVSANIKPQELAPLLQPATRVAQPWNDYVNFLRDSQKLVPEFYRLEKAGAFKGAGTPEGRDFTRKRLALGSQMLVNLWYTAWLESAEIKPEPRPRTSTPTE